PYQIPAPPSELKELDLMKRLAKYADGKAYWDSDMQSASSSEQFACHTLYSNISNLINLVFSPILNRANSGTLEQFTMHDAAHGRKVAHLMWYLLNKERRNQLTPPEIAILVLSAFMHDIGMWLDKDDL